MKVQTLSNIMSSESSGIMSLFYGATGVGKTVTLLKTAQDPLFYIYPEKRPLKRILEVVDRPTMKAKFVSYEGFQDLLEFLGDPKNVKGAVTLILDGFTHLMNYNLSQEIADEAHEAKTVENQKIKPLINRSKLSLEGYGGLSGQMDRLVNLLMNLSSDQNIKVAVTALVVEHPSYAREYTRAPALKGREFGDNMPGCFDLIGFVQDRLDETGTIIYPPWVSFKSVDGSYLAKFTGPATAKTEGPLDLSKILK